ncbi:TPA: 3-hydroxyacyl-CoA dehydrogenase family protein [Pseudomonas putida]|uniref:3-hydroxyacyl-CoA dehydrogenase family protein n=1 Tax=Pseudomonas TaxID=286 RepID=UPI000A0FF7E7|nr:MULTISPECIES: 3-hydroxyacyl-CoA dehydrogenase family protein [Pseudomonas]MCI1037843.1 3-hydroxyacyl-CoA dehydrogenase family protein [Pseudomonas putida]MCX2710098.1 3-hydroxyacyl-CoA dehydrogenase family protein [Pseudomonas sp. DCB_BG]ORL47697.1 3-hydroxyacyl-CoA dehydrogenase [Pseudomonas putida]
MHKILQACVIGAGLMGHGIAQVFAQAGHKVSLYDPDAATLDLAPQRVAHNLDQMGIASAPILANIGLFTDLREAVSNADIVIEAVPERLELKQKLFADIAGFAPPHTVLASNTSVIPITAIGEMLGSEARARLVGTHWWNPPHLVPLVEVVRTEHTSLSVFESTFELLQSLGKSPVKVNRDVAGFIGNRLQHAMWREAISLVSQGVCDAETIDTVVKQSFGMRLPYLGPMENADLVGLQLTMLVHQVIFPDLCNDQTPNPLLETLLANGHEGMRSGEGLRSWTKEQADEVRQQLAMRLIESVAAKSPGMSQAE